jgi:putative transposase
MGQLTGVPMVWTAKNRGRYDRRGQRYPSDLTNEEWTVLQPLLPVPQGRGRPREHQLREVMNGIRYVLRYGIPWDAMPKDLPPSSICYDYWRLLTDGGHMEQINHRLVMMDREKAGREASPTLAIIDAQSVKCDAPQGERGYDAGKKVLGRKRHIAVDINGRLLAVKITSANVQDQDGGIPLVKRLVRLCPWIKTVVVDGGYKTRFIESVQASANRVVEVVKRPDFAKGFVLLPKRWRVEQSIGALTGSRRLKLDYETLTHVSAAAMLFASITRLLASITMG